MTNDDKCSVKIMKASDYCLSSMAIAELFDISEAMVRINVNQHGMPRVSRGQYSLVDCVQWMMLRLKMSIADDNGDIAEEKLKLVKAQRQRVELENMTKRGELLDAETVGTVYNQAAATYSAQLDGLGARVASILAGIDDPGEIQRVIFDECRAIRESTTAELIDSAYKDDGRSDHKAATVKKRRSVGRRKSSTAKRKS